MPMLSGDRRAVEIGEVNRLARPERLASPISTMRRRGHMQLAGSILALLGGLYVVLIADLDESSSDMRLLGWLFVVVGLLGLLLRFVLPRRGP
jgi:hypothetical protein